VFLALKNEEKGSLTLEIKYKNSDDWFFCCEVSLRRNLTGRCGMGLVEEYENFKYPI